MNCIECSYCIAISNASHLKYVAYGVQLTEAEYNVFIEKTGLVL